MFFYTDTADAPWTVIKSDDKKRARLNAMQHFLSLLIALSQQGPQVGGGGGPAHRQFVAAGDWWPRQHSRRDV